MSVTMYIKGGVMVLLATICFSFQPIFGYIAYADGVNATGLLWLRFLFSSFILHFILKNMNNNICIKSILLGVFIAAGSICYFSALKIISIGLLTILFYLFPCYIFLLSVVLRQEYFSVVKFSAILLSIIGVYIGVDTKVFSTNEGLYLGVAAGACYGAYIMLCDRFLVKTNPLQSLSWIVTGALVCLSIPVFIGKAEFPVSYIGYIAALGLCLVSTLLSLWLLLIGSRFMGSSTSVAILATTEIGSTLFLSWLLLNESVSQREIIGAILVFLSSILVVVIPSKLRDRV